MTEDNIITISLNVSEELNDMKWTEIIKRMTEQLKMMAESQPRFLQGEEFVDEKKTSTFGDTVSDPEQLSIVFKSSPKKSSSKSMSSMNKAELMDELHSRYPNDKEWRKTNLKKFNIKELKHAFKNDELPTEERDTRLASKPPRKITSYMLWINSEGRAKVKEDNPELKATEVTSECGKIWKAMSDKKKNTWNKKADKAHKKKLVEWEKSK